MRKVTYSMGMSLDGYIIGPDGRFDWSEPDDQLYRNAMKQLQSVGVHLMGRRLYETMLFWETAEADPALDANGHAWAAVWNPLPKVVFSNTLTEVQGSNTRLASGTVTEEIERLQARPDPGDIAIGGATLAAEAAAHGLIDEYLIRIHPVLVGGGVAFFPNEKRRVDLELIETETFDSGIVYARYQVKR